MILFGWAIVILGVVVVLASRGKVKRAARRPANGEEKTLRELDVKTVRMFELATAVRKYAVIHHPVPAVSK